MQDEIAAIFRLKSADCEFHNLYGDPKKRNSSECLQSPAKQVLKLSLEFLAVLQCSPL